jgi:hypothetical protein
MVYAMIPRSFSWYVMGGGLSRAFGMFFLILSCASTWALLTRKDTKFIILTILFGSGAILSHPETGLHAAAGCALILFFKGRNVRGFRDSLLVVLGITALTSLWWGSVLFLHGFTPFQSALRTGGSGSITALLGIASNLTEEPLFSVSILFGIIGIVLQAASGNWFFLIWLVLPFFVEWRSATAIAILPLAILAGLGFTEGLIPLLLRLKPNSKGYIEDWTRFMPQNRVLQFTLGFYLFYTFVGAFIYDFSLAHYSIPLRGLDAMHWVKTSTPSNSRFIVLTNRTDPFSDPTVEWFPAITTRICQNTIQGKEWLLGKGFLPFLGSLGALRSCLNENISCITQWADSEQLSINYIYIEKYKDDSLPSPNSLLYLLHRDDNFSLVYENESAVIFERK